VRLTVGQAAAIGRPAAFERVAESSDRALALWLAPEAGRTIADRIAAASAKNLGALVAAQIAVAAAGQRAWLELPAHPTGSPQPTSWATSFSSRTSRETFPDYTPLTDN